MLGDLLMMRIEFRRHQKHDEALGGHTLASKDKWSISAGIGSYEQLCCFLFFFYVWIFSVLACTRKDLQRQLLLGKKAGPNIFSLFLHWKFYLSSAQMAQSLWTSFLTGKTRLSLERQMNTYLVWSPSVRFLKGQMHVLSGVTGKRASRQPPNPIHHCWTGWCRWHKHCQSSSVPCLCCIYERLRTNRQIFKVLTMHSHITSPVSSKRLVFSPKNFVFEFHRFPTHYKFPRSLPSKPKQLLLVWRGKRCSTSCGL